MTTKQDEPRPPDIGLLQGSKYTAERCLTGCWEWTSTNEKGERQDQTIRLELTGVVWLDNEVAAPAGTGWYIVLYDDKYNAVRAIGPIRVDVREVMDELMHAHKDAEADEKRLRERLEPFVTAGTESRIDAAARQLTNELNSGREAETRKRKYRRDVEAACVARSQWRLMSNR